MTRNQMTRALIDAGLEHAELARCTIRELRALHNAMPK